MQLDNDVRFDVSFRDILGRHHPKLYFTYTYLSPTTLFFSIDNENQLCVVCIDSPRSHILVPCGHVCASAPRVRSARSGTSVPCVGRRPVWCCERSLCDSITLYLIPHTSCDSWFPGCVSALAATALGFICFRLHLFSIVRGPSGATALPRRRPTHLRAYFIYHGPPGV